MHMAVTGEVAVMAVDHRDARADETRDRKHRNAGSEREGGVGVAQVIEAANGFDAGGDLGGSPVAAAEDAEVDPAAARVRDEDRVYRGRQAVARLNRLRLQRHRARAQPRLGVLDPAVRVRAQGRPPRHSKARVQRVTVTRRKVAGIEVMPSSSLAFWLLKRSSSSACNSASR